MGKKVIKICPHCHQPFELGYNGIVDGCDKCLGIERDLQGHAWLPDETEHTYRPIGATDDSQDIVVTRDQAFGRGDLVGD